MDTELVRRLKNTLRNAERILITSHKRPDGDAVGSLLGLGLVLQNAGKEVQMVLEDGVPSSFRHLSGSDQVCKRAEPNFDISIILDCSDIQRMGGVLQEGQHPTINIDHHITNLDFAQINLVETQVPATAEILAELIPRLGLEITQPAAEALLTGIITDTLGFRTQNIRSHTLRVAADLMDMGCDLPDLYRRSLLNRSFKAARYWGAGLSNLQLEDRLLWATLNQEDRKAIGYPGKDDADLINILSSINDVDIAIIFVEQTNGTVKVSWRAREGFDVSQIAYSFGGGGHKPAAGAEIEGDLEFVKTTVLAATRKYLQNKLTIS